MALTRLASKFAPAILALLVAVGCFGKDDDSGGEDQRQPDPRELIQRAGQELDSIQSFHFVFAHEKGASPIVLGLELKRAEGDIVKPDRLKADVEAVATQLGNTNVNVKVVAVGDEAQITNPFNTRQWISLPGTNPLRDTFDPAAGTRAILNSVKNPRIVGEDSIDGKAVWKVEGELDGGDLKGVTAIGEKGYVVKGFAWIGKERALLYRVRLEGPVGPEDRKEIVRTLELSKFDERVTIELPD